MKRVTLVLVALALLGLPTLSGYGEEPKRDEKLHDLMQRKLAAAQKVLEGIALNDFEKIGKQADELIAVSKQTEWRVIKTPQFELHGNDFRRTGDNLAKAAKEKNIDAAALSYVELTLICVKCHKYVRETRNTNSD